MAETATLITLYGACPTCGAPRDVYDVTHENGDRELRMICTGSVGLGYGEWGHGQ